MSNQQRFSGEWGTKRLGEMFKIHAGTSKSQYIIPGGKYIVVDMGSVATDGQLIISKFTDYEDDFLKEGDLVMPKDDIGGGKIIGKAAYIDANNLYILGDHVYALRLIRGVPKFFSYLINSYETNKALKSKVGGSAQLGLSKKAVEEQEVPIPTYEEQHAIAEVLSDVDGSLNALDALIAKKRGIKQATMQQLLTGKTRLPGFSGAWETKRLGKIAKIQKGSPITEKDVVSGTIPVIAGGQQPAYFHNTANRTGKTITVSGSGAYAGFVAFHNQPIFASDCSTISESPNFSIDFIYYYLIFNQDVIYKAQTGGAQPHIHPIDLMPLEVNLPSLVEQRAIAAVLSDMDAEISALEQLKNKNIAIKQGMMQQLLTGRVRLVKPE